MFSCSIYSLMAEDAFLSFIVEFARCLYALLTVASVNEACCSDVCLA